MIMMARMAAEGMAIMSESMEPGQGPQLGHRLPQVDHHDHDHVGIDHEDDDHDHDDSDGDDDDDNDYLFSWCFIGIYCKHSLQYVSGLKYLWKSLAVLERSLKEIGKRSN